MKPKFTSFLAASSAKPLVQNDTVSLANCFITTTQICKKGGSTNTTHTTPLKITAPKIQQSVRKNNALISIIVPHPLSDHQCETYFRGMLYLPPLHPNRKSRRSERRGNCNKNEKQRMHVLVEVRVFIDSHGVKTCHAK